MKTVKARKTKAADPLPGDLLSWVGATVTPGEAHLHRYQQNADAVELLKLAQGLPSTLAWINARACTAQTLRLYRDGPGKDPKRPVPTKRLDAMASGRMGAKAAEWSQSGGEAVEVTDHPVLRLLNRPTRFHTGRQLEEIGYWYRQITGDSFDQLILDGTVPIGRAPMIPAFVVPQPDEQRFIRAYYYRRDQTGGIELEPEQVLHMKHGLHPTDPYRGAGWLNDVRAEARILATDAGFDIVFAERGYQPPFAIQIDEGYTESAQKQWLASMQRLYSGFMRMTMPLLLWKAKYQPTMTPAKDLQSLEKRREHRLSVLAASGIPESMVALNDANLASAQQGYSVQYLDLTVRPMCNAHAEQMTEILLPRFGVMPGEMWLAYDDPVPANETADADRGLRELAQGAITVDEYRASRGMGPMPKPVRPVLTTIDPNQVKPMPPGVDKPDEPEVVPVPVKRVAFKPGSIKALGWWTAPEGCCDHGEKAADDLPAGMVRDLTAWYERVIRANARPGTDPVVPDVDLDEILRRHLPDLLTQAARVEAGSVGVTTDLVPDVERVLENYLPRLSAQIRQTTAERIAEIQQVVGDTLREGVASGASADQIADEIGTLAPEEAGYLAERVARTETAYASTQGRLIAWNRAGIAEKEWLLAPGACPVCSDLQQRKGRVKAGEPFARAGETFGGYTLTRDCDGPPLHPNDRCSMRPVVEGITNG